METETDKGEEEASLELMEKVFAIWENVTWVSTMMVALDSPSTYGIIAGEHRNASRGELDVLGVGN